MRCFIITGLLSILLILTSGCSGTDAFSSGDDDGANIGDSVIAQEKVSQNGIAISHTDNRRGRNCMDCHFEGNNPYIYTVAGTVYQLNDLTTIYPDATIKFYSEAGGNGTLLVSLEVDSNGNFYTTEPMDFSAGVYPVIEGTAGESPIHMGNFITHGECNSCHGSTTSPIYMGQELIETIERVSENGLTLSHTDNRRGSDCTTCHEIYSISGSVKDLGLENFYADATLKFYSEPNSAGQLVETLEVDSNGNFYTTQPVNFGAGLYPVVESADGIDLQHMSINTINGACNSCHGVNTLPIFSGKKVNTLISQHGATSSHIDNRRGQNCMSCHVDGSGNTYIYTLAGTVYQQADPGQVYPNATLYLYSQPNGAGDLVVTLEVDANGNFYTTEQIDFAAGLYPAIVGNAGVNPVYMTGNVTTGECNSCHDGAVTAPISIPGNAVQRISANGTSFSHTDGRRGVNCLGCHNIGGDNPYQYSVAGTVYELDLQNFYADATISLYSSANGAGDLVATIEVDSNGNFYTTESIDLGNGQGNGLYPAVTGRDINSPTLYMNVPTNNGGCSNSSCHGINRPQITAQ